MTHITPSRITLFAAAVLATTAARADFVEVAFEPIPNAQLGTPAGYQTWRAVARFDNEDDWVVAVSGDLGAGHPLVFNTNDPAGLLNQPVGCFMEGFKAEDFIQDAGACEAWDSYVTIGHTDPSTDDTDYNPGFLGGGPGNVIKGTDFVENAGGWYDADPGDIYEAGPTLEIVIAQFTVKTGSEVSLSGLIQGFETSPFPMPGGPQPFETAFSATGGPAPCPTDIDGDGETGFGDVLAVLARWGSCTAGCPEDVDGNFIVDFLDLLAVLAAWGPCP